MFSKTPKGTDHAGMLMTDFTDWTETEFYALCRDILAGMGMAKAAFFPTGTEEKAFRSTIPRESSDGLFLSEEEWLCIFARSSRSLDKERMRAIIRAAISADPGRLLLVVFDSAPPEAEAFLFERLSREDIRVVFLSGSLAETLALDYSVAKEIPAPGRSTRFSFARLRDHSRTILHAAPWRERRLDIGVRPMGSLSSRGEVDAGPESDLSRASRDGSFLLLGDSGSGKTAGLTTLVERLAESGGRTPVFIPLGRCKRDLLETIREALAAGGEPVSKETAEALLRSGALVLALDGLEDVFDPASRAGLMEKINQFTYPSAPSSRCVWIVSCRTRDYRERPRRLTHLESHRLRIQPLAPDVVFQFLVRALGEDDALSVFQGLDGAARERFSTPLLLSMALAVYKKKGEIPAGRRALYGDFIDGMLQWAAPGGEEENRAALAALFPDSPGDGTFRELARAALSGLAEEASTTIFHREEARRKLVGAPEKAPADAGVPLLETLLSCGVLVRVGPNHIRFFHDSLQEYFNAPNLKKHTVDELIPDGGAPTALRRAALFAALAAHDPAPFFLRALEMDLELAFDILTDPSWSAPPHLSLELAGRLWRAARKDPPDGENRYWAMAMRRLADLAGKTVEELAAEMDGRSDPEARGEALLEFYTLLGDAEGQRRVLEQAMKGAEIPDEPLFSAAGALHEAGGFETAVASYTAYLEKHPDVASACNNRGLAYESMKRRDKALEDYERAIALEGAAYMHENLATLLYDMGRYDQAISHMEQSLERDPTYARSHAILARWLEAEDPEAALSHREAAVRYTPREELSPTHFRDLSDAREKRGRWAAAAESIRGLIALDPTSPGLPSWKERIAGLTRRHDVETSVNAARDRFLKTGRAPFPMLIFQWLRAAGVSVGNLSSTLCLAKIGGEAPFRLPVVLIPEPFSPDPGLREALDAIGRETMLEKRVILVTEGEALAPEAWEQLAALQAEYVIIHVTAGEVESAFLAGDHECHALLDSALEPV